MSQVVVVRGRYADRTFIPDGQLPDGAGTAELIITPDPTVAGHSIFDLFGKAPHLRTAADIAAQIQQERDEWGEP
jgi:hypothetical protein